MSTQNGDGIVASEITPLHKDILVYDMYFGEQITAAGIIITDDDKKDRGIHPRWAKVYAVGQESKTFVKPEQWVLILHGRWSRGIPIYFKDKNGEVSNQPTVIRKVDPTAILLVSDTDPQPNLHFSYGKE